MTTQTNQNFGLARLNELLTAYYLNGEQWPDSQTKQHFEAQKHSAAPDAFAQQDGRAKVMADAFLKAAARYGFRRVKKVLWTAVSPTALQHAVDPSGKIKVDARDNPSDLLVEFATAPVGAKKFLGLSAKSTTGKKPKGITFKNPGLGTVESDLHIDLGRLYQTRVEAFIKRYHLSPVADKRKAEIRAKPKLKQLADAEGDNALEAIRDALYNKMRSLTQSRLREWLLSRWMDADDIYPPYLKVTGVGVKEPYTAKVEDPRQNEQLEAINTERLTLTKAGRTAIIVSAGNRRLIAMGAKFDSQKMAGSIKFRAEPA